MPRTFVYHPRKGPARTEKQLPVVEGGKLRIEQVRSGIGHPDKLRRTLRAMGLRHHQDVVVCADSPGLRGQIKQVRHLIKVTPVEE
jgi:large subunit ribosomal protein L30